MKAFSVQCELDDCYGAIVFHESAGKARYFAMQNVEYFECYEDDFKDFTVKREPRADLLATDKPSVLDYCENSDFFHSIGWECYTRFDCNKDDCKFKSE